MHAPKRNKATHRLFWLAPLLAALALSASAQSLQLLSVADPSQPPPAGGGGDSWGPTLSRDGRYVLFSSTANNLVLATNNSPIPPTLPSALNVFLRDRTNATTSLVSLNLSGVAGGNADSVPIDISTNGRYVLFESSASDLVPGDTNNATDVFVRDLVNGATSLVSVNTNGVAGNGPSGSSVMTPDGRYVAFVSAANDLVAGDTNGIADVFVRDLQTGTTVLASAGAASTINYPFGSSEAPVITPDGRYVAFYSTATNLVAGAPATGDIYVRDLVAGVTTWASAGARAATLATLAKTNIVCFNHALSDDGQLIAYEAAPSASTLGLILRYNLGTSLTELVHTNAAVDGFPSANINSLQMTADGRFIAFLANTNDTSGETTCVLVWDARSGTFTLASGDLTGSVPTFSLCESPTISSDGRFVLFLSTAGLVTNDTPGDFTLYLRDLQAATTILIDADTNGIGSIQSPNSIPSMSADGHFVAFDCNDGSLAPNDRNHFSDAFLRDVSAATTELVSVHDPSLPCVTPNGGSSISPASISRDGRLVAFASDADNLLTNDTNQLSDIFVRDLFLATNRLVSVNTNGVSSNGESSEPSISADGRYVAFTSSASDLVQGDTNYTQDVFVRDLQTGTTTLVSLNSAGTGPGNTGSYSPIISADGRLVLFRSRANNLASGLFVGENLFLRDRQTGTNYALSHYGNSLAAMTPDGRFVFYPGTTSVGSFSGLYVWDSQAAGLIYTNTSVASAVSDLAISDDGKTLAFAAGTSLYTSDLLTQTNRLLESGASSYKALRLTGDGTLLTCVRVQALGGTPEVYLYGTQSSNATAVSRNSASGDLGNGPSDSPDISVDGRFIAYRSAASNIVANVSSGFPNVFLYDVQNGTNSLLSASGYGGRSADNRSLLPVFSGDGHTLCFVSWASNLVPLDFNQNSDVFAFTFLYVNLLSNPSGGTMLSWPYSSGKNYRVQFKDKVDAFEWQNLTGTVTNTPNKAWLLDPSLATQRFYRVLAY